MSQEEGWIKLSRKTLSSSISDDPILLAFWIMFLLKATHKKRKIIFDGEFTELVPGEFFSSERALSDDFRMHRSCVRRCIEMLEKKGSIERKVGKKKTIYKILKYKDYQHEPVVKRTNDRSLNVPPSVPVGVPLDVPVGVPVPVPQTIREEFNKGRKKEVNMVPVAPKVARVPKEKTEGSLVWESYAAAYEKRYGANPVRNAKTNALCVQLVKRLGADAGDVAGFYLTHNAQWYVTHLHQLEYCVKDAEKLHVEWRKGRQMTVTLARDTERVQSNRDAIDAYFNAKNKGAADVG